MTFTAVVVTHANTAGARTMLRNLAAQTRPPEETILVATETSAADLGALADEFPGLQISVIDEVGDWGHAKRERGLQLAVGEWIGWFNDDDSYDAAYLERMLELLEPGDFDVAYCAWNEQPECTFEGWRSTAGNFIVSTALAREIGWTERVYHADGLFIDGLVAAGARVARIDDVLYFHNVQEP